MSDLPYLTTGQLRALRIAAKHMPRSPRSERVENHPLGRQYVTELETMGLLAVCPGGLQPHGRAGTREVTSLAVAVLRAHWTGERMTQPKEQ
jgi:hypothetical protein